MAKKGKQEDSENVKEIPVWKCILFILIGAVCVVKGSDFAVSGASEIARNFGMSERFIGLTIVALGTSALICSIPFEPKFLINTFIAVGCGVVLWLRTIRHQDLRRPQKTFWICDAIFICDVLCISVYIKCGKI